jgi:hypothetical protein
LHIGTCKSNYPTITATNGRPLRKRFHYIFLHSCKYPIRRIEVKVDTVPRGNTNYVQDNIFLGQLPKRLVIGCVDSDALNGTITKNPFRFKHYKINFVALNVEWGCFFNKVSISSVFIKHCSQTRLVCFYRFRSRCQILHTGRR